MSHKIILKPLEDDIRNDIRFDVANCVCVSVSVFLFRQHFQAVVCTWPSTINSMIYAMRKGCLIHLIHFHFHADASPVRRCLAVNQIIKIFKN